MTIGRQTVVGIDLGTTCSLVAWIDATGRPSTLVNAEGDYTTPSAVFFDRDEVIVGKEAEKIAEIEADRVVRYAKRDMGRSAIQSSIRGEFLPPEVIQALILKKLKKDAIEVLGGFERAVITVPAYFDEPRRKATQDAARLAGVNILDILNEPTAAAIAYSYYKGFMSSDAGPDSCETVLVYDLGGGTFDVTLMQMTGKELKALGTAGDVYLGGVDWTARIADFISRQYVKEYDNDPRDDEAALQSLMREAEDAKRALTSRHTVNIAYRHDGQRLRISLARDQFEDMTHDLLDRTVHTVRKVLREAGKTWDDLTQILLVGGASRMPAVEQILERTSGLKPDKSLSPDEAVVHGAAIYAALLAGDQTDRLSPIQVSNVNSHDLGVLGVENATGRNRRRLMIPRNTILPCKSIARFKTFRAGQTSVKVNVIEGGDASGNNATQIGKCVVTGLPPNLPARTPVEVMFRYRANGRLLVDAFLPTIGKKAKLHLERTHGLSKEAFDYWLGRIEEGLTDDNVDAPTGRSVQDSKLAGAVTVGILPTAALANGALNVSLMQDPRSRAQQRACVDDNSASDSDRDHRDVRDGFPTVASRSGDRSKIAEKKTADRQSKTRTIHPGQNSRKGSDQRGSRHSPSSFDAPSKPLVRESEQIPQDEFSADEYWDRVYQTDANGDSSSDSSPEFDSQCSDDLVHADQSTDFSSLETER